MMFIMNVSRIIKTYLLLVCLCVYGLGKHSYNGKAQNSGLEKHENNAENFLSGRKTQRPKYEVLDVGCTKDERCIVIAFCDPAFFSKETMEKIAEKLSIEFRKKKIVNVNLFDKRDIAKAYAKGTRELGGIPRERRGWYFRSSEKEFLLFSPDENNHDELISVKPKQKNE